MVGEIVKSIEGYMQDGADIASLIREETVLMHAASFDRNSCEARVVVTIDLPDGRVMSCNKVIRLRFSEVRD